MTTITLTIIDARSTEARALNHYTTRYCLQHGVLPGSSTPPALTAILSIDGTPVCRFDHPFNSDRRSAIRPLSPEEEALPACSAEYGEVRLPDGRYLIIHGADGSPTIRATSLVLEREAELDLLHALERPLQRAMDELCAAEDPRRAGGESVEARRARAWRARERYEAARRARDEFGRRLGA
jgi:hypothetical protein